MAKNNSNSKRERMQWLLLWVVVITIGLGWKYPFLGFSVPVVMVTGISISILRGRYACGNVCPRGAFLDRIVSTVSPQKKIPPYLRTMGFRWLVFVLLIGFMLYRGLQHAADPNHWGYVFWTMCVVTTVIALAFSLFINSRTWCSFCPVGTLQNVIGGGKERLLIDSEACKGCRLCEKACTFTLPIANYKNQGTLAEPDCIKCSQCIVACPAGALSWPEKHTAPTLVKSAAM